MLFAYQSDRTLFKFPWVLETFGLERDVVRERLATYCDEVNV